MNQALDLERLHAVSSILGLGIPEPEGDDLPREVAETLKVARRQMKNIPAVLEDLVAAQKDFAVLDMCIDQLQALALEAGRLPEEDQQGRDVLEIKFVGLSRVLAGVAGRSGYGRPEMSLKTKAQAQAAAKILRHLEPVKETMAEDFKEQERLIIQCIFGTITFLEAVCREFPLTASATSIPDLLQRVKWVHESDIPVMTEISVGKNGLH
ncbi:MAG: hypothetical protein V1816_28340 [Pseudomonadota bacterium]